MTEPPPAVPARKITPRPSAWKYAALFAVVAVLMALPPFCEYSYRALLDPGSDIALNPAPAENLPELVAMTWRPATAAFVTRMGTLTAGLSLSYEILLAVLLIYALLRMLNPTFRVTTGVTLNRGLFTRTYIYTPPAIKAFLIAATAVMPMLLVSYGIVKLLHARFGLPVALALVGLAMWFLFSRDGVAGDYDSGNYELPRDPRVVGDLLLRGALAGLVAWGVGVSLGVVDVRRVFSCWQGMGGVGEGQWWQVAAVYLLPRALTGALFGALLAVLAQGGLPGRALLRAAAPWAVLLAALALFGRATVDHVLLTRYDFARHRGDDRIARLGRLAGVPVKTGRTRTLTLLVDADKPVPLRVALDSSTGVLATGDSAQRIERFLRRRRYRTSLARAALATLHEAACLQLDPDAVLGAIDDALAHVPDPASVPLLEQQLQSCAATPEAKRLAGELADERRFRYTTRAAEAQTALLFARLGETQEARAWLTRAGAVQSRIDAALAERRFFCKGEAAGRLTLDGMPAAGVHVALVPAATAADFGALHAHGLTLAPYWLSAVTAGTTTGPDGQFSMADLPAGSYRLLVDLPAGGAARSATGGGPIAVGPERPRADIGTVALRTR